VIDAVQNTLYPGVARGKIRGEDRDLLAAQSGTPPRAIGGQTDLIWRELGCLEVRNSRISLLASMKFRLAPPG
jgi:hypothetical protein